MGPGKYPWGNDWPRPKGAGNYADPENGLLQTMPVASYTANNLGVFDLGGNVWECCESRYKASMNDPDVLKRYPELKDEKDDDGTAFRVVRGASWGCNVPLQLGSSYRARIPPGVRGDSIGFRCVLVVSGR